MSSLRQVHASSAPAAMSRRDSTGNAAAKLAVVLLSSMVCAHLSTGKTAMRCSHKVDSASVEPHSTACSAASPRQVEQMRRVTVQPACAMCVTFSCASAECFLNNRQCREVWDMPSWGLIVLCTSVVKPGIICSRISGREGEISPGITVHQPRQMMRCMHYATLIV